MVEVTYRLLDKTEYELWDTFLSKSPDANIYQVREYYEALKILNWVYEIYVKINEKTKEIISGALIQIKRLPLKRKVAVVNYGPISLDKDISDYVSALINYLKTNKYLFCNSQFLSKYEINIPMADFLGNNHTYIIDLTNDLDLLFTNFSKTFRNCVRKAEKEGVIIEVSNSTDTINLFLEYYQEMVKRKQIETINLDFLRLVIKNLIDSQKAFIAYTKYQDIIYNMAVIGCVNQTARYLYGASNHITTGLPPMGQALHYEIIKHLKNAGCTAYDLGGVVAENLTEDHPSYGVWKFKKGFGGEFKTLTNNYQIYFNPLIKLLFKIKSKR